MKQYQVLALALGGLMTLPTMADDDNARRIGDILEGINMFTPEDGDPAYKVKANELYGTQWGVDVAYAYWGTHRSEGSTPNRNHNYALLHAQLNQRLIQDDVNGGTWLRVEVSGTWGLDKRTAREQYDMVGGFGAAAEPHVDIFGPHNGGLPELALMQYLAGKRICVIGGMVNLTNYFDGVSIANDTFSGFTNSAFTNSKVLPLTSCNSAFGAVIQAELNRRNYVMAAAAQTGGDFARGTDPFKSANKDGFAVVGEYGHLFGDDAAVLRINPFYRRYDAKQFGEGAANHHNAGLVASIDWNVNDNVTVFARAGYAVKTQYDNSAELTFGTNLKLIPSREDDFLGLAAGVIKGQSPYGAWDEETDAPLGGQNHRREYVLEATYSFQVNDYVKVMPHFQYIARPAAAAVSDETVFGVQTVVSF